MKLVPLDELTGWHTRGLAASMLQAPADERDSPRELLLAIKQGRSWLYEFDGGLVLCSKRENILLLDALWCEEPVKGIRESAQRYSKLGTMLKQLAAEFKCDKIKTIVFDPRLACVIEHLGGYVESRVMTLPVESRDGQEQDKD